MLTGEIRRQIDDIWNDFWTGGVSNPLSVIEQITYLLFIKRLDELESLEEAKAAGTGKKMERRLFPPGKDKIGKDGGCPYKDMRWSRFKTYEPRKMFEIVDEHVFPFLRTLGGSGSLIAQHMKDARNGIPISVPPHARRQRLTDRTAHEGRPQRHPDSRPARQGRRQARSHQDGRSRHQGRCL